MNFLREMKRHGFMKALNEINKFNEMIENSPTRKEDSLDPSQGDSLKDVSTQEECKKGGEDSEVSFVFPFQRRARSLSPPKPSLVNSTGKNSLTSLNTIKHNNSGTF